MEEWRPLKISRGGYEVSNLGGVRNARTGKLRKIKPNSNGTNIVSLGGYVKKTYSVARLVAMTFVSENIKIVRHKGNLNDDSLSNLRVEVFDDEGTDY